MAELVRVRIKNGNKYRRKNMGRAQAEKSDNVEILEGEPTHKRNGNPLPETTDAGRAPKPQTTVGEQAAAQKATARSASTEDEKE